MSEKDNWTTGGVSRIATEWRSMFVSKIPGGYFVTFESSTGFEKKEFASIGDLARHLMKPKKP